MRNTTLCYIEKNGAYLMMLRNKKKVDENAGKWVGVGGKFEEGESPEECVEREVLEETGLHLTDYCFRGLITFVSDEWGCEYMHLFTADAFEDSKHDSSEYENYAIIEDDRSHAHSLTMPVPECEEGELRWIAKEDIMNLNLWEGDRPFLKLLMESDSFFTMRLQYEGDKLVKIDQKVY
ncbi:MAG: 8-oxo-dGTP diphosphatase [Agathobacter sp.]|uniref:NUDIX hydrolase n=1 Tax=Agathobacter sp. TaxID=2021311 RepID=UPI00257A3935|nr:8-oxo-dGTP diphosphatase [Agathobacter sp.]MBQ1681209.1 8-oxo-dGTP diphosphatase [Agathobacter sp.]